MTAATAQVAGCTLQVAFRLVSSDSLLAGGPIPLEAVVSLLVGDRARLISRSARATGRGRDYAFAAEGPDGAPLRDPFADVVEIGGVQTTTELTAGTPVVEALLLNQFLALEDVRTAVPEDGSTVLVVRCARRLQLGGQPFDEAPIARAELLVRLHRDDAALTRHYSRAAAAIGEATGFTVDRERQLVGLCSARSGLAADALASLLGHPDPDVATRARQALAALT